jgi:hypothetical protein
MQISIKNLQSKRNLGPHAEELLVNSDNKWYGSRDSQVAINTT